MFHLIVIFIGIIVAIGGGIFLHIHNKENSYEGFSIAGWICIAGAIFIIILGTFHLSDSIVKKDLESRLLADDKISIEYGPTKYMDNIRKRVLLDSTLTQTFKIIEK